MIDADLVTLYQDIIIDHNKSPRNFRELPPPRYKADGYNPLCGDRLSVYLTLDGERISDVSFTGDGCAISVASASLMTETLKGKTIVEAETLFNRIHALLTGSPIRRSPGTVRKRFRAYANRVSSAPASTAMPNASR